MRKKLLKMFFVAGATLFAGTAFDVAAAVAGTEIIQNIGENIMISDNPKTPATYTFVVNDDGNTVSVKKISCFYAGVSPTGIRNGYAIDIPETIIYGGETLTVTAMANRAADNTYPYLKTLKFPSTLKTIGDDNFKGCRDLESIDFGGVEEVGSSCFYYPGNNYQTKLKVLNLSNIKVIGNNSFTGFPNLTNVALSPELESIGSGVFANCPDVKPELPEGSTHKIIDGVMYQLDDARVNPVKLVQVMSDFKAENLVIPSTVTEMAPKAFRDNKTITSVDLGNNLTEVPDQAFWGCSNLTAVTGGENITRFGYYAFYNCTSLQSFEIGPKVTEISLINPGNSANPASYQGAFKGCTSLTDFTVSPDNTVYSAVDGVLFNKDKTELLCVLNPTLGSYDVPAGVTAIADFAFADAKVELLVLGNDVETIGAKLFNSNKTLTSLTIGKNVTTIGERAFQGAEAIEKITVWPATPPAIDGTTFYYSTYKNAKLYCANTSYNTTPGWSSFVADNVTGVEDVIDGAIEISVNGNSIIAPEGSKVYNMQGVATGCASLAKGAYIVVTPNGKVEKVLIK